MPAARPLGQIEHGRRLLPFKVSKKRVTTGMVLSTHVSDSVVIVGPRRDELITYIDSREFRLYCEVIVGLLSGQACDVGRRAAIAGYIQW